MKGSTSACPSSRSSSTASRTTFRSSLSAARTPGFEAVQRSTSKEFRGEEKSCRVSMIGNAGHHVYVDQRDIFTALVCSLIGSVDKAADDEVPSMDTQPTFHRTIGNGHGGGPNNFDMPCWVIVLPSGVIVVCDNENHRLQFVKEDGTFLKSIGNGQGGGPNQFSFPGSVVRHPSGVLVVNDRGNKRPHHILAECTAAVICELRLKYFPDASDNSLCLRRTARFFRDAIETLQPKTSADDT